MLVDHDVPTVLGRMEAFRSNLPSTVVARLAPGMTPAGATASRYGDVLWLITPQARAGQALAASWFQSKADEHP